MRVTQSASFREAKAQVARHEAAIAARQRELASGRRLNAVSDDPFGAASAITQRSELAKLDSYVRASDSVQAKLAIADSVLSDVVTQVTAALSSATGAVSTATTTEQREAIAIVLEGIRDIVFADVNTQLRGTFLFAGAATTTQPYTKNPAGAVSSYRGDHTAVSVDIDQGAAVLVSFSGDALLRGSETNDVFVEFDQLIAAIRANNQPAIDAGTQALDRQLDRATAIQTRVGTDLNRLTNQRSKLEVRRVDGLGRLSRFEDVNLVDAITGLQEAETAHQTAIRAIGTRLSLSLFDFLR